MRLLKHGAIGVLAFVALALCLFAEQETKYSTSATATDPYVTFAPGRGNTTVKCISFSCDSQLGTIKFYSRPNSASKYAPTSTPTNGATVIAIANTGTALTTNNLAVYMHDNGTVDYRTISAATTSNVTLSSGISAAGATGDYLYEITQQGQIVVGGSSTGPGTNSVDTITGDIFVTPNGNSPLHCLMSSETNTCLSVTVDK